MKKMLKKCSTDQRFIRKRYTTYIIGTLTVYDMCEIKKPNSKTTTLNKRYFLVFIEFTWFCNNIECQSHDKA